MVKIIEGNLSAKGLRLAIAAGRFNNFITDRLIEGAMDVIARSGGDAESTVLVKVPGAFELPLAAKTLACSGKYDAVVCLGAVIRGSTSHFEYVTTHMSRGISNVMMETGVPISFGVVTADNLEQAIERTGTKHGNKGAEATLAAVEMANVIKGLK
ncbi:MAG: 6,7-dimethyl-8-ribityllumazine synthase [Pseudomonadota bacterium]